MRITLITPKRCKRYANPLYLHPSTTSVANSFLPRRTRRGGVIQRPLQRRKSGYAECLLVDNRVVPRGKKRRARDSNPQPLTGHFISNEAASHSLTLLRFRPSGRGVPRFCSKTRMHSIPTEARLVKRRPPTQSREKKPRSIFSPGLRHLGLAVVRITTRTFRRTTRRTDRGACAAARLANRPLRRLLPHRCQRSAG